MARAAPDRATSPSASVGRMARLLVIHHSPTPTLQQVADAALEGARHPDLAEVDVVVRPALEATVDDVLAADGYLLGSSVNLGYLSGALKHCFDTIYDDVRDPTAGRPFGYWLRGRYDATGAQRAMESITTGLQWRRVAPPLVIIGEVESRLAAAADLGATLAAILLTD